MKISMKDYRHNEYDSREYSINRDICCSEMMQPTVEANSYNSERIYISPLSSCISRIGRKTSSRRTEFSSPYISEDADYIFDGITGTLPLWWCAYIKLKERYIYLYGTERNHIKTTVR